MTNSNIVSAMIYAALTSICASANAQSSGIRDTTAKDGGPSLGETMQFIQDFAGSESGAYFNADLFQEAREHHQIRTGHYTSALTHQGCSLFVVISTGAMDFRVNIAFEQVDPLTIETKDDFVHLITTGAKPSFTAEHVAVKDGEVHKVQNVANPVHQVWFWFPSGKEATSRFDKAVRRAVTLCGGKVSPF